MMKHGEWKYSSTILNIVTRWRRVFLFTPRPLYPRGENPRYLVGPQTGLGAVVTIKPDGDL
jgi:hypothetical protein